MNAKTGQDLKKLGRNAAESVAEAGVVEQVEVVSGEDSTGHPAYFFSFQIDLERVRERLGLFRSRLVQKLQDDLTSQKDSHLAFIQLLSRDEWDKRAYAELP